MVLRRIIASFFVFMFVIVALPTFLVYGISKSFFSGAFYKGPILETTYPYLIEVSASHLYNADKIISKYFDEKTIKTEIEKVLTPEIFRTVTNQFGNQIENLKKRPDEPRIIDLRVIRQSLLTVTHNLAYRLFENIPICVSQQLPEINTEGIPTCILAKSIDFASLSGPLSQQFEKSIYGFFPEQLQIDLRSINGENTSFYYLFTYIDSIKTYLLGILIVIMAIIALILYQPISLMLYYEAIALILAGFGGIIAGVGLEALSPLLTQNFNNTVVTHWLKEKADENIATISTIQQGFSHFINDLFSFIIGDIQKIALVFIILGIILFFIHFLLKRKPFTA